MEKEESRLCHLKKKIFDSIDQTIGNTPIVKLNNISQKLKLSGNILAKLEFFNPLGSVKDRIGLAMIDEAEKKSQIRPESVIIEATSGNTGIALAFICAARGYNLILTMPSSMSIERRKMLTFLGAKIVLTPKELGMDGAIDEAKKIYKKTKNSIILDQFKNQANPDIHFKTTAHEIWSDTQGKVDFFFSGVGTGGTITGVGEVLKKHFGEIKIIGVEPATSAVLSGNPPGPHKIQGIGAGFKPNVLNFDILDRILPVSDEDAFLFAKRLGKEEGIIAGSSSGAACFAANQIAKELGPKKNVVVVLPCRRALYES